MNGGTVRWGDSVPSRGFDGGEPASVDDLVFPAMPVAGDMVVEGSPSASAIALGEYAGMEVGVWEHTVGASTDVEVDELFVVLSGRATVRFLDEDRTVELRPGTVMRLFAGQRTEWKVTETLRKVYLA